MSPPELLYLIPGRAPGADEQRRRQRIADDCVPAPVTVEWVGEGPRGIESAIDEAWSVPSLLHVAAAREPEYDALVVGCFGDTGLRPLRELLSIPTVGPAETTVHTACQLASRFSWLTPLERTIPMSRELARTLGVESALTSVRALDIAIDEMGNSEALATAMGEAGTNAVEEDNAEAVVPGCMSLAFDQTHATVAEALPVPLLDPLTLSLEQASTWARTGVAHSDHTYPPADRDRLRELLAED